MIGIGAIAVIAISFVSFISWNFSDYFASSQSLSSLLSFLDEFPSIHTSLRHHWRTLQGSKPRVVKAGRDRSVYLISDGMKHHIPDWVTFVNLGYSASDIQGITVEELNSYPLGDPIVQLLEDGKIDHPYINCPCISASRFNNQKDYAVNKIKHETVCFEDNKYSRELLQKHSPQLQQIYYKVVANISESPSMNKNNNYQNCDHFFRILPPSNHTNFQKYQCPERCAPRPVSLLPIDWLEDPSNPRLLNAPLTCSLTPEMLMVNGTNLHHHMSRLHEMTTSEHRNITTGLVIHEIIKRRKFECSERENWPESYLPIEVSKHSNSNDSDANKNTTHHHEVPRRHVYGLILWVGSLSRFSLMVAQSQVLKIQDMNATRDIDRIVGWMASEEIYSCRLGTTLCEKATSSLAYFPLMPTTQMHVAPAGWSCAQRRPLRSLAHSLLLYNPEFVLLADDDTFINIDMLLRGTPLSNYVMTTLKDNPYVHGELTLGRKITRRGFYYGGAGYLMGRGVLDRLEAKEMIGPPFASDSNRDPTQVSVLSVLKQIAPLSKECPPQMECVRILNNNGTIQDIGSVARLAVRVVDVCANIMSDEHTCFHSDHAMSRCLAHGIYATIAHSPCGGATYNGVNFGMCMGTNECRPDVHLTCHRYMPLWSDHRVPVPAKWNETSTFSFSLKNSTSER